MAILDWFKSLFSGVLKVFKKFIELALPIAKQLIIAALKDIAMQAVAELKGTDMANEDKRKAAFNQIKEYATNRGIKATDSLINTTIELAVQTIKF